MLLVQLYRRMERIEQVQKDGSMLFPLTQQHIADALGLSLVHTNKTLRRLSQLQLHTLKGGRLTLLDVPKLATLAKYDDHEPAKLPLL